MDPVLLRYVREVIKQLHIKLHWIVLGAAALSFLVLGFGVAYQPGYETSITIYADNQNVIKPLLEGGASITEPKSERIRVVRETMFSQRILEQVINTSFSEQTPVSSSEEMENAMAELRTNIELTSPASDYIKITYSNIEPEVSYQVINKITNLFIEESAQTKRSESKSAYTFIDEQVKSYKDQLVEAENKLKSFEAANIDGVEAQVNASLARLRSTIDDISIDIEAEDVRIAALENQLSSENRYASSDYNARVYRDRLAMLESQLGTLRLNYRDEHPDIIDIQLQIQDLKRTIVDVENASQNPDSTDLAGDQHLNPIYEELSNQLAASKVNVQTMRHRLIANQNRLQQQYERRVRVASNQASLSELTRDYSVTKNIYEDLLERKERARISMTLDLAGQGVTYKVLEPAVFPILPIGIRFLHFAIAGPIVGLILATGILVGLVLIDPKIKFPEQLSEAFPGIVLAVVPVAHARYHKWGRLSAGIFAVIAAYCGLAIGIQVI